MRVFFIVSFFLLSSVVYASEDQVIFRDYYYGQTRPSVMKASGAEPCDNYQRGALCTTIYFAGGNWQQIFFFNREGLQKIVLSEPLEPNTYSNLISSIYDNGFISLWLRSGEEMLDLVALFGKDDYQKQVSAFMDKAIEAGELVHFLLELDEYPEKAENASQIIRVLPSSIRATDLYFKKINETWHMTATFYFPGISEIATGSTTERF